MVDSANRGQYNNRSYKIEMDCSMHYRLNKMVVHELIDGEAIIINLDIGCYYNLEKTAADIWNLAVQGIPEKEMIRLLSQKNGRDLDQIVSEIHQFLDQLQKEGLIITEPSEETIPQSKNIPLSSSHFETPVLNKYTDMKEFFQADPIHDVDEQGWPKTKQKTGSGQS